MNGWLYAASCIVAPTLWGVLMVWALGWAERTRLGRRPTATGGPESLEERHLPSPEYHI